jgi:glutamate---cysteine ligase / carboxylate-amine ligase
VAAPSRVDFDVLAGPAWPAAPRLTLAGSRAAFEHERSFTVGVEEELLLVDPTTYELAPVVDAVLPLLGGDRRFAQELRPSQLETVSRVCATAADACRELAAARRDLVAALDGRYRIVASGTHPWSTAWGAITEGDRYRRIADEYTWAAQRSLACGLHVHVAVDGADRALAVFNAIRSYLPELAALTANSPYFEGRDIGMSSVRPKLNDAFPRSGIPPVFHCWDDLVRFTDWGRAGGLFPDASHFWWELRPHLGYGTLEIRVADSQTSVVDAAAVVAVVQALVAALADRYDRGDTLAVHETHWITENAWRAHRYGVRGWLVDLDTGAREPTRVRIERLLTSLEPYADTLGGLDQLRDARVLLAGNGSDRQRYVYERAGRLALLRWLADTTEAPVANA